MSNETRERWIDELASAMLFSTCLPIAKLKQILREVMSFADRQHEERVAWLEQGRVYVGLAAKELEAQDKVSGHLLAAIVAWQQREPQPGPLRTPKE